jgi:hypothetical protein
MEHLIEILDSHSIHSYDFIPTTPSSSPLHPFLLIDGNLGIPTSLLQELYTASITPPLSLSSTVPLLMINPDHNTAWNIRRKQAKNLPRELCFSGLVIGRHPKRGAAWSYRAWVLDKMGVGEINATDEVDFGLQAASAYFQNYYAWTYLRHIFTLYPDQVSCYILL